MTKVRAYRLELFWAVLVFVLWAARPVFAQDMKNFIAESPGCEDTPAWCPEEAI